MLLYDEAEVMFSRDLLGPAYLTSRSQILAFVIDGLLRKHMPRMFSLKERKSGDRRQADTVLVSTRSDTDSRMEVVTYKAPSAPYDKSKSLGFGGKYGRKAELETNAGVNLPGPVIARIDGSIVLL